MEKEYEYITSLKKNDVIGIVAYWLRPTAYNGVNGVQFPAVLFAPLAIW